MLESINNNIKMLFTNNVFLVLIKILLLYYIIFISFKLNNELVVLLDNQIIKILIVLLIFYSSIYNIEIAILIMLSFIFSLNTLNKIKMNDLLNLNEDINYLETSEEEK
tara:strand:+ start:373 stop:699 length:327 start_codon:yes stop_codon:yes gene_type:complete